MYKISRLFDCLPLVVAGAFTFLEMAHAAPSAQEILTASDHVRNPDKPFSVTVSLTEYRNGSQAGGSTLNIFSKAEKRGGKFDTLIRFAAPARDANKLMLKSGNDLWFYDPNTKATIRISPQQRLLGQAANGDVVTVNLAKDYKAVLAGEEDTVDGDRQIRRCFRLELTGNPGEDVTYHRIEMWIQNQNNRPVKAKFYSESNRLLKTAFYRGYRTELGMERPTETIIIDGLDPKWVTVMRFSDYEWKNIPDAWMQRDYLTQFRPE